MMERNGYFLIADISGYTDFIRIHNMRRKPVIGNTMAKMYEAHAEKVISDLLEAVIEQIEPVMELNKLEGDAAFFFCDANPEEFDSDKILSVMQHAHNAFNKKASDLVFVQACGCEPCLQSKNLRLKIVAHKGKYTIQKIRSFVELAGEDVILTHRMLKNNLKSNEYWLITEEFANCLNPASKERFTKISQKLENFGNVPLRHILFNSEEPRNETVEKRPKFFNFIRQGAYFTKPMFKTLLSSKKAHQ